MKNKDDEQKLLKVVEATLFLSARYINLDELVRVTSINPLMLREILLRLEEKYRDENGGLAIARRNIEGQESWKMDVKPEFAHLVNQIATGETEFTKAEQETLAIIAYKQPIKQSIIVKIRGNKAYDHIKHLVQAELVRTKKAGRTLEINVSDKFYNYFNLKDKKLERIDEKEKEASQDENNS